MASEGGVHQFYECLRDVADEPIDAMNPFVLCGGVASENYIQMFLT